MQEPQQTDRTVIYPQLGPGKLLKTYMGGYEWEILFDSGRRFRLPAREFEAAAVILMGSLKIEGIEAKAEAGLIPHADNKDVMHIIIGKKP